MFRLLYRQRRRILFSGLFMALAVYLGLATPFFTAFDDLTWINYVIPVATGLIMGLATMIVLAVAMPILPDWRHLGELLALMLFIQFVLGVPFPDTFGIYADSIVSGFLWFAIFVILYSTIYGTWLDRFPMWLGHRSTRSVTLPLTAESLWPMLLPGKAPLDQHWDALLTKCTADPDDPDSFDLQYAHGQGLFHHVSVTYLEERPYEYAKYYFQGEVENSSKSLVDGTFEVTLNDLGDGHCEVTISETRNALLPRVGLQLWFDDYLGDHVDHMRAQLADRRDWSLAGRYRRKAVSLS